MAEAYLLTGGNTGDREAYLSKAAHQVAERCGPVLRRSSLYETAAWGMEEQPPFLNQVLLIKTALEPLRLLQTILSIEEALGRKRTLKYGPRTIDIDILFYNDTILQLEGLHIPHPRIQDRRFVLVPLNELAPGKIHPVLQKTLAALLKACEDPLEVNKIS
ncbi:MAG TPA: 2-amino-4-hydroxy-6-hydroxymethyldihydropteridine diphosphokinase [Flavisolibacter sp.]|nr:2-amino-4-hydroxy-6-hydroxymethyldihydropteridine diphosphokinase [Flavisolibacter sp.]